MMARTKEKGPDTNLISMHCVSNGPHTRDEFLKLLKEDKPNMIINITGLECEVSVDSDFHTNEDCKEINSILSHMIKDIWIDRTYVSYSGNRFKDAFITESGWYEMIKLLIRNTFLKKRPTRKEDLAAMECILTISKFYLYGIAEKFGYDADTIDIEFKEGIGFESAYYIDERKEWKM